MNKYLNRFDAGQRLGKVVASRVTAADHPIVLALPRGGVPVGAEVAKAIGGELDLLIVRKLGMPFDSEYAFGAIGAGDAMFIDRQLVDRVGLSQEQIDAIVELERAELARREAKYRAGRAPLNVAGRTVVVVDDGIATGASMKAALKVLRGLKPGRVVLAVPVAPADSRGEFAGLVDEFICPLEVMGLGGVGRWYESFEQVEDDEVLAALR